MDKILKDIYYDPKTGFTGFNKFWDYLKKNGVKVSRKDAKDWYDKEAVNSVYKKPAKADTPIRNPYQEVGWVQADLLEVGKWKGTNRGYRYILNIVDIYSRYAWSYPIKGKTPNDVLHGVKDCFNQIMKKYPDNKLIFATDMGNEFKGAVNVWLKNNDIDHFTNNPDRITQHHTMAVVERFNKTLWLMFRKIFYKNQNRVWHPYLDHIVSGYNNRVHGGIKKIPKDVYDGKEVPITPLPKVSKIVFNVGDFVRIAKTRGALDKKTLAQTFGDEIHKIDEIKGRKYLVNGKWYGQRELLKAYPTDEQLNKLAEIDKDIKKKAKAVRGARELVAVGHDAKEIKDDGTIIYKKRLQPTNTKRISKPKRY